MLGLYPIARLDRASLAAAMPANDERQDYVRARVKHGAEDGDTVVEPFRIQDSSMLSTFAMADALIVRPPWAPAAELGAIVPIVRLRD
jgi:molybdopterin molybdotransferase